MNRLCAAFADILTDTIGLHEDQSYHVCHRGYVSILPLLLELLPVDSPHVKAILDLMRDPVHLWSPYGLRSLSTVDEYFGKDENYWRGPIWVQMSYLALRALKKVSLLLLPPSIPSLTNAFFGRNMPLTLVHTRPRPSLSTTNSGTMSSTTWPRSTAEQDTFTNSTTPQTAVARRDIRSLAGRPLSLL